MSLLNVETIDVSVASTHNERVIDHHWRRLEIARHYLVKEHIASLAIEHVEMAVRVTYHNEQLFLLVIEPHRR